MANVDSPFGLKAVGTLSGAPINGAVRRCYIPDTDTTAVFVGDLVSSAGTANEEGIPEVAQWDGSAVPLGVVVGIEPDMADLTLTYRKASTARYVLINVDPQTVYEIQEDGNGGATMASSNATVVVGTGNTLTGLSGMELDSSSAATTNNLPLRVMELVQREDNALGTNAKWLVTLNDTELHAGTGTAAA